MPIKSPMLAIKGALADHDTESNVNLGLDLLFFMGSILWLFLTQGFIIIFAPVCAWLY